MHAVSIPPEWFVLGEAVRVCSALREDARSQLARLTHELLGLNLASGFKNQHIKSSLSQLLRGPPAGGS